MSEASHDSVLSGEFFMQGDIASAEGAICAGCRFFGGYPITPATEVAQRMSERLPLVGGIYIQMEDELASMNAVLGASWAGMKAMTSTSGPGFSLMMENLGLGIMLETPCVLVNVQRGGPSTGLPTLVGQGDMMQARYGSHGDYSIIALAPSSPQELFDLTIHAFNLAEIYRTPVLVMTDAEVGHMTEKVVIPPPEEIETVERRKPTVPPEEYQPYRVAPGEWTPPMAIAGDGYRIHTTGLTHDERGYPATADATAQWPLVRRLIDKIEKNKDEIIVLEEDGLDDDTEVAVVSYGIAARTAVWPIQMAREEGIRVGMLRLVTVWPFPDRRIRKLAGQVGGIVVPEINMGQIVREVERCAAGQVDVLSVPHPGGGIHDPQQVLNAIRRVAGRKVEE
ncbi:MAG: 2-oxoacid:acceptor oxidoreductase subunit alpha [Chloroflexota bacterium]|nr:2-oxoacid:acceptor oxidoreductase subunit alpha [Chloroflexota bacterium]